MKRGSRRTSGTSIGRRARDALAERQADPAHLVPVQAVRRRQGQAARRVVQQVERADLDVERLRRTLDERPHQLVPVPRLRREAGELVEKGELAEGPRRCAVDDGGHGRSGCGGGRHECRPAGHPGDCGARLQIVRRRAMSRRSVPRAPRCRGDPDDADPVTRVLRPACRLARNP